MATESSTFAAAWIRPQVGDLKGYVGLPTADEVLGKALAGLTDSSDPEVYARIQSAAASYIDNLKALRRHAMQGNHKAARAKAYHMLNSFPARVCAALLATKRGGKVGTWNDLSAIAFKMDCRRPSGEPVLAWAKKKRSGGWRPICDFRPIARGCQRLVLDILRSWMGNSPFEYARKGRGRDRAIQVILERIRNGGARWFITADIRDFYRHIDPKNLSRIIPLPEAVIMNVIAIPEETSLHYNHYRPHGLQTAAREGVPQGSLVSAFIAGKVLEAILQSLATRFSLSFIDNLCLGLKTEKEAMTILHALSQTLFEHPVGPLLLKDDLSIFELGQPNDVLHYRIHRKRPSQGGYAYAHPSPAAFDKMIATLRGKLANEKNNDALLQVATNYVAGWLAAQGAWERSAYAESLVMDHADIEAADEHSRRHPYVPTVSAAAQKLLASLNKVPIVSETLAT